MANSIDLATLGASDVVAVNNAAYAGALKVVSAAKGNVTFVIDGKKVNLSDAGSSYLGTNLAALNKAAAEANPSGVLLALAAGSTNLVSGNAVNNATIKAGASATEFVKGSNELELSGKSDSDVYKFNHLGKQGEVNVVEAKAGAITIQVNGDIIELADANASYISTSGKEIKMADAEASPANVLFALKNGTTKLVSGTKVSNAKIAKNAAETVFYK